MLPDRKRKRSRKGRNSPQTIPTRLLLGIGKRPFYGAFSDAADRNNPVHGIGSVLESEKHADYEQFDRK
jgi:hypothetical protein